MSQYSHVLSKYIQNCSEVIDFQVYYELVRKSHSLSDANIKSPSVLTEMSTKQWLRQDTNMFLEA